MNEINITKYNKSQGQDIVFYGEATVKKGFYFVDGDEHFYHFIGKNSVYSVLELLHPDDVGGFLDAVGKLSEGEQCAIVRMKCYNDTYRYLYMTIQLNGRMYDDFQSFTFEFCDIMEIKDRYAVYMHLVKKYRAFMSLSSLLYFEYIFEEDELKIYHYVNVKSRMLLSKKLEEIKAEVIASTEYSIKCKAEFEIFYEFLKKGTDRFDTRLDANVLIPDEKKTTRYQMKGCTMYQKSVKNMVIGIINVSGKAEKKSYYLTDSAIDPGTGLFNKRAINEYTLEKIQECDQNKKSFYLAVIDVDDFKKVNDTYGHMFGDEVLSKVSEIMRDVLDARGIVGRFGGDEFMIVFESVDSEEQLRRIVKTICKHIMWAYESLKESLMITTSWGIAKYPDNAANFEELFAKADKALYIAKAKGKNRVIIYDEEKHDDFVKEEDGSSRDSGIRTIASDEKKAAIMTDLVVELHQKGKAALSHVMEMMCAYFDMDGVAIYQGDDMKRMCSYGNYVNPIEALPQIVSKQYLAFFDKQGIYEESNVKRLSKNFADIYKLYELQENGKFVQCISCEGETPKALVSFDFFNRYPKIGTLDMGLIKIVGRLMAEVAGKNEI